MQQRQRSQLRKQLRQQQQQRQRLEEPSTDVYCLPGYRRCSLDFKIGKIGLTVVAFASAAADAPAAGLNVSECTYDLLLEQKFLVVTSVSCNSQAAVAGVTAGDLVTAVNGHVRAEGSCSPRGALPTHLPTAPHRSAAAGGAAILPSTGQGLEMSIGTGRAGRRGRPAQGEQVHVLQVHWVVLGVPCPPRC
jgi:hypothetical protein